MATVERTVKITFEGKDEVSGVLNKVTGSIQKLGKLGVLGLGAAAAGVAGLGAGLAKLAIDAAPLEGIAAGFEGLTENIEGGSDAMLKALEKSSGGMISQRDLMLSFNKAAQLVSTDFAERLPDAMNALGKVASSTGQDLDFLLDSLVVGTGRLSPMILDNLGIQVSLTEANDAYAKSLGINASELTKAQQQTALMNQVLEKLAANTADMPDATQGAAAGMARFEASIQNAKDTLGVALAPVLADVMELLGDLLGKILPPLTKFFTSKIVPAIKVATGFFSKFVDGLIKGKSPVKALTDALKGLGLTKIATQIENVANAISDFIDGAVELLQPVIDWVAENINLQDVLIAVGIAIASVVIPAVISLIAALFPIIATAAAIIAAVALLRQAWETDFLGIRTALISAWENFLLPAFNAIREWLAVFIPKAVAFLSDVWENVLKPAMEAIWKFIVNTLIPIFEKVILFLGENIPKVLNFLSNLWENVLLPAIEAVWKFIEFTLIPIFETIVDTAVPLVIGVLEVLADIWENVLLPAIEAVWGFIQDPLFPLFESLAKLLKTVLGKAIEVLTGLWENILLPAIEAVWEFIEINLIPIVETLASLLEGPLEIAGQVAIGIFEALKTGINFVIEAVRTVVGWINTLIEKLENLELPEFLQPGSPPPLAIALQDINKQMRELARMNLPELQSAFGGLELAASVTGGLEGGDVAFGGGAGGDNVTNITNNFTMNIDAETVDAEDVTAGFGVLQVLVPERG